MAGSKRRSHGEGTIYRRKDGRWEAAISLGDGTRKRHTTHTQADARRWLTQVQRDRDQGLPMVRDERQTLGQYLPVWLEMIKPAVKPRSYERYEVHLRVHLIPALGHVPLGKLTPQQVQQLVTRKLDAGLARNTVACLVGTLHHALEDAQALGLVAVNVAARGRVKLPKRQRRPMQVYDQEQALRYLAAARGHRYEALFVLMLTTGMREAELFALRWRDVHLETKLPSLSVQENVQPVRGVGFVFDEPKTETGRRRILLTPLAVEHLRAHRRRQLTERQTHADQEPGTEWNSRDLVFCRPDGRPLARSLFRNQQHVPLVKRAELPYIRPHDLRHTAATLLIESGVPIKVVSEMLGHANITITLGTYAHVTAAMQQQATVAMSAIFGQLPSELPQSGDAGAPATAAEARKVRPIRRSGRGA